MINAVKRFRLSTIVCVICALTFSSIETGCGVKTFTKEGNDIQELPSYIAGVDVSTLLAEEASGVIYYDENKKEKDIMEILMESGINTVRIRVWNDPYDSDGNSYGGGNNDIETAITIGKRATQSGMGVMIDFHYSDFWADPAKQMAPKLWENLDIQEKSDALYEYTCDSLRSLLDAGVDVNMVQVGNETNSGMCGETDWDSITKLMSSGSKAVNDIGKEYGRDIKVVLHFTNPEKSVEMKNIAKRLEEFSVDYDIFATSYYPYWHGSLDNLVEVLDYIADNYNKNVLVAETAYVYTLEDGDGCGNTISTYNKGDLEYEISPNGQSQFIKDLSNALDKVSNSMGIMYWEPGWIPVPDNGNRSLIWEEYGSGWASKYASDYDPEDAGKYYGGNAWDNQTLFGADGIVLPSLKTLGSLVNNH